MRTILLIILIALPLGGFAQVGIDNTSPEGIIDVSSSTSGVVLPVVSLVNVNTETVLNPQGGSIVAGTVVYNTATTTLGDNSVYPGLYAWDGATWVALTEKQDNELYLQTADLRPGSDDLTNGVLGDQTISFDSSSFTPVFSGTYRIVLTLHYGGGNVNSVTSPQLSNFAEQEGEFDFTFNGTTHTINVSSFTGWNNTSLNGGSLKHYTDSFNQVTHVIEETLTRGTNYPFSLTFNQAIADGFEGDGDISVSPAGDGRGYIIMHDELKCSIEFNFAGEN